MHTTAQDQGHPATRFVIGQRVIDSLGQLGTVTHTRVERCVSIPDYQRVEVTTNDGGWSEQAASKCHPVPTGDTSACDDCGRRFPTADRVALSCLNDADAPDIHICQECDTPG